MAKYNVIYKCPMCGKEFTTQDKPVEMEEHMIPELLAKIMKNQQFLGTVFYEAPLYLPHQCGNGDGGLAPLIGFRKVKESEDKRLIPKSLIDKILHDK